MSTRPGANGANGSERRGYQNTCKYTINDYSQIRRLQKIREEALKKQADPNDPIRFHPKDVEFIGMLCTDGSIDFRKRNIAIRGRDDGLLIAFDLQRPDDANGTNGTNGANGANGTTEAGNPGNPGNADKTNFGIQSAVHLAPYNDKIASIFHFQNTVPVSSVNCSVRQLLDRECPKWGQFRSRPRESVHHFLSSKIQGRSTFLESRRVYHRTPAPRHWKTASEEAETAETIEFSAAHDDVNTVIETLRSSDAAEYYNGESQRVVVTRVQRDVSSDPDSLTCELVKDGKEWIKFDFHSGSYNRHILTSVGLYTVILEENKRDDGRNVYLHGVRKFASQICYGLADVRPSDDFPLPLRGWDNEARALEVIRAMGLTTHREFDAEGKFAEIAAKFNITYAPPSGAKRSAYSAHVRFNGNTVLRGMDETVIGRFQGAGYPKEELTDIYLAAMAAHARCRRLGVEQGVAALNAIGRHDFDTSLLATLGCGDINLLQKPGSEVVDHRGMLACILKDKEVVVFGHKDSGVPFAVYAMSALKLQGSPQAPPSNPMNPMNPEAIKETAHEVPEGCVQNPGPFVANALARLTFIIAACRSCPGLARYERTLRANWLSTERERPECNQNVHDLQWLSSCAKDSSNSFHWSVLPYSL